MSLPPLSLSANTLQAALQKSQPLNAASVANRPAQASQASTVQTVQTLINELKITQPTTLNVKVEGTGIISTQLLTQLSGSSSQTKLQSSIQATTAQASHSATTLHWSKVRVTQALSLLLTYPSDAHKSSSEARQLSTIGSILPITVLPNGHLSVTPKNLSQNTAQAITNSAARHTMPTHNSNAPASSSSHVMPSNLIPSNLILGNLIPSNTAPHHTLNSSTNTNNLAIQSLMASLSKLDAALNAQPIPSTAKYPHATLNHLYNNLTQLMGELKPLSPAISQQLLPNKLINTLTATVNANPLQLPSSLSPQTPQAPYSRLIEIIQKHIENGNSQAISNLQQGLNLSQQIAGSPQTFMRANNSNPAELFGALVAGLLPKHGASSNHIQETRQAIARWLSQELSSQISRMASTQIQSHTHNLERPNEWSQQIDIPLRWGDEFGNVQLRIEQKKDETNNAENERKPPQKDNAWEIAMDFELPQYTNASQTPQASQASQASQTMTAHLKLQQSSLSVEFWSQDKMLNQTIESGLSTLAKQLQDSGLNITRMLCHQGIAPTKTNTLQQTIIDIKT